MVNDRPKPLIRRSRKTKPMDVYDLHLAKKAHVDEKHNLAASIL